MADTTTTTPASPASKGRKKKWFIAGLAVGSLILLLLIVVMLLPMLISGGLLRAKLQSTASDMIAGSITWDKLNLGWGRGQSIEGLRILDAQGNVLLVASKADAPDVSLRSLAMGSKALGKVTLTIDQADIVQEADGQLNILKALEFTQPGKPRTPYPAPLEGWTVVAQVKGSGINIQPLNAPALQIASMDILADLSDPGSKVDLTYQLAIQQNGQPAGQSQGSVTLHDLFNATGDLQLALTKIQAEVSVDKLPVSLIAALTGQDQKLETTLGSSVDASLTLDGPVMNPQGQLVLRTPALSLETRLASTDDTLEVTPGRVVHFRLSEQAWQAWSADPAMQLEQPVELDVQVRQLIMPRSGLTFDWPAAKVDLQLKATPLHLRGSEQAGRLSLSDVQMAIQSESLGRRVTINAQAAAARNEHQGQFRLNSQLRDLMDANGQVDLRQLRASLDMEATNLPVALADQLLASPGKYETLIGPNLQARAKATIEPAGGDALATGPFELTFSSDQLQGRIVGSLDAQALTMDDESALAFTLTPRGATAVGLPAEMLQSPAVIKLAIRQVHIPRRDSTLAIEQGRADVTLTSEPLVLAGIGQFQSLSISGLQAAISTQALGKEVKLSTRLSTQADGNTGSLVVDGTVRNLLAEAQSTTPPAMDASFKMQADRFPVAILEGFTGQAGSIEPWIGRLLDVAISGQTTQGQSSWLEQGSATVRLQSDLLQTDLAAKIEKGVLHLQPASQIDLQLAANVLETQGITLAKPVKVTVRPGSIQLPVSPLNLDAAVIDQLTFETTPVEPAGDLALTGYRISALQGQLASPRLSDRLTLAIDGKISRPDVADSPIRVRGNLRQPMSAQVTGDGSILLEQVAVPVVDMILKQNGLLVDALGPLVEKLEVNLQTDGTPVTNGATWQYQVAINASHLNVSSLQGRFTPGQQLVVDSGGVVRLKLTPGLYARFMTESAKSSGSSTAPNAAATGKGAGNPIRSILGAVLPPKSATAKASEQTQAPEDYVLASPANVVLTLNGAKLNLASKEATSAEQAAAMDLADVSFDASVTIDELALTRTAAGDTHRLRDVKATLQTQPDAARAVHVKAVGQTLSEPQVDQRPGRLDVDLTLAQLSMLPEGGVNWYDARIQSRIALQSFPTALIDHLASQQGRLTSLLGASMQSQVTGSMPGNLDVSLQSPQSTLTALLAIDEQRVIRLREDLKLELNPTPEAVAVLGLINPQLLALESAQEPVSLQVKKQGFELPMPRPGQPLDLQKVHSELTLNVGQVRLRREGMVKDVFEVLAGVGGKFASNPIMDVRFTPLEVKLDQGHLTTNDLWMISQDLIMGTQAKVDMTRAGMPAVVHVGLSGQTLRHLPGARSNLPADLVVDVKLAAPLTEIKLDKAALAVQITPLLVTAYGGKQGVQVLQGVSQGVSLLERLAGKKPAETQGVMWLNHPAPEVTQQVVSTQPADTQPAVAESATTQPAQEKPKEKESPVDKLDKLFNKIKPAATTQPSPEESESDEAAPATTQPAETKESPVEKLDKLFNKIKKR